MPLNLSIDTGPQQQEATCPQVLVVQLSYVIHDEHPGHFISAFPPRDGGSVDCRRHWARRHRGYGASCHREGFDGAGAGDLPNALDGGIQLGRLSYFFGGSRSSYDNRGIFPA